jgi:hypothetical protein
MNSNEAKYLEKRERLLRAIEFRETDRLPVCMGVAPTSALEKITGRNDYKSHAKEVFTQAMKEWDVDVILQFVLPDRQDRQCGPNVEVMVYDGLLSVVCKLLGDWSREHGAWRSPEDFRDFCESLPPAVEAKRFVDADITFKRWLELDAWGEFLKPIVWLPGHLCGTVSWMWYNYVGYENYLMAHSLYPEAIERLFAFLGEEGRLRNIAIARAIREHNLIPIVYSGEDICGNDGPLVSPQSLRDIYFPHLKRAVEPLINAGVHWLWHSDGNILPILPELLDCGIDGFQGFEEDKGMDMLKLAETPCRNGKLPYLFGSVNVTTTFYETPASVRSEVQRMIDLSRNRGGGTVIMASSSIMENTPVENVMAYFEAAVQQKG